MRKNILILWILFISCAFTLQGAALEENPIKPLKFPKFSLGVAYALKPHFMSVHTPSISFPLGQRFNAELSFDMGLYSYLNAGIVLSGGFTSSKAGGSPPLELRYGIFLKPYWPIKEKVSLFTRFTAGLAINVATEGSAADYYQQEDKDKKLLPIYHDQQYLGWPFGAFSSLSVGAEFFPFQRFGFAFEWGIRGMIMRTHRNLPLAKKRANDRANAPRSFNFIIYEMPIMLTLHGVF